MNFPQFPRDPRLPQIKHDFVHKRATSLIGFAFGAWLIWAAVCLAGAIGIVCVVWHFVSKFW